jgi:hypothetical protein
MTVRVIKDRNFYARAQIVLCHISDTGTARKGKETIRSSNAGTVGQGDQSPFNLANGDALCRVDLPPSGNGLRPQEAAAGHRRYR